MSVKHGHCDARPMVTFSAARHHPPVGWYQIILLGDRGTCALGCTRQQWDSILRVSCLQKTDTGNLTGPITIHCAATSLARTVKILQHSSIEDFLISFPSE